MERQICTDCGLVAPQTDTDYTLISGKFGWRLHRRKTDSGWTIDWRCPDCWRTFKKTLEADPDGPRSAGASRPSSPSVVAVHTPSPPSRPSVAAPPSSSGAPPPSGARSTSRRG